MPKNSATVQIQIPGSRYKIGDLVKYKLKSKKSSTTYFGTIESRLWIEDLSGSTWEYIVTTQYINQDSVKLWEFEDSDCVLESDLEPWDGSKKTLSVTKKEQLSVLRNRTTVPA